MNSLLLLNGLKSVDIGFFIGCGVVIALIIAVYYLIPVFNKKQYEEQRENLRKREAAFRANKGESYVENEMEDAEDQNNKLTDDVVVDTTNASNEDIEE